MKLQNYLSHKLEILANEPQYRNLCTTCLQPEFSCYCTVIEKFDAKIEFAILIHPIEVRRRIATGRMSHLCLKNSHLLMGQDYSAHPQVNALIQNPQNQCLVLYPGKSSLNLTPLSAIARGQVLLPQKNLVIFVIDGTWATAKKMMRQSLNLAVLPRICFSLEQPSQFRVRKQPAAHCYSTIEAIHQVIELLAEHKGFATTDRQHDLLLKALEHMVQKQLHFIRHAHENPQPFHYRREFRKPQTAKSSSTP